MACANTEVAACWMIWFLVRFTTSAATFVSTICDLGGGEVFHADAQVADGRVQRVLLERTQVGAQLRHLIDRLIRDLDRVVRAAALS